MLETKEKNKRRQKQIPQKIHGHKQITNYITKNYKNAEKIIEIGPGKHLEFTHTLNKNLKAEIIPIDIKKHPKTTQDNVFNPNIQIYKNTDLIYSIRPPLEIQKPIAEITNKVQADLIIKPFEKEIQNLSKHLQEFKLKNLGPIPIYIGKPKPKNKKPPFNQN
ncbi:UPF0146 family protein [Methanonatronarchaeum thermophilum]|uniref:UPF0146 family protein n=1 Tax=Methanonatronarchaeum thermophilum TaxID=1927129 RepID=UPI00373FDEDB